VLTFERETIENIILKMRAAKAFEPTQVRLLEAPVEKTSGDIALSAFRPDKSRHIMLGDFSSHGLMAAVAGPIVYDVFYSMTTKGLAMQEIISEINRQLLEKMPTGLFLGAIFLELSADRDYLYIWNCGMSDVLIYRKSILKQKVSSSLVALGIIKQAFGPKTSIAVETGDRIYAYSDGITEAVNNTGEEFGQYRLEQTISELLTSQSGIEFLYETVKQFSEASNQLDDITLLELTC
ncbi:MAG: serine/threonine-protein phosphatase, partial [Nitrosomonadaceae bacterium]|nr:serine/threonine-protein phosphatase [Nitrosomonadaceae bacterium]